MYLEHFNISELPFTLTPNVDFFCNLAGHQAALNILLLSLRSGEGFIKIVGEVGTGKTLLCRLLLNKLEDNFVVAYLPNPDLSPNGLRRAIAHELGVPKPYPKDTHVLLEAIIEQLMQLHQAGKRAVLLIDEAQALSVESLEALRLLTNLETEKSKLLQMVLFGQPELDERLNLSVLRQLKQRISFSYRLGELRREELNSYLCHRLAMAGYTYGSLFTKKATDLLFKYSKGTPRLINVLCHKAMMAAYGRGEKQVTHQSMRLAIHDTESAQHKGLRWRLNPRGLLKLFNINTHVLLWGAGTLLLLTLLIKLILLVVYA